MLENVGLELIGFLSGNGNTGGAHVTEVLQEIQDAGAEQVAIIEAAQGNLAPVYNASSTYAVGDYVLYNNVLYRCTTAITTAEAWTAAHWTAVNVGGELTHYKQDINELESQLNQLGLSVVDGAINITFEEVVA